MQLMSIIKAPSGLRLSATHPLGLESRDSRLQETR